jgi:hypothetical protein
MRNVLSVVSVGLIAGCSALACSGSSGSSVSATQAATDVANAFCARIDACASYALQLLASDVATCGSRASSIFSTGIEASSSGWTPSAAEACAQAIPKASCDDVLDHNLPSACVPPAGQLATGATCGDNAQCMSGYCNLGPGGKCGTCAGGLGSAGAPCYRDDDCVLGTKCVAKDVTVTPEVQGKCTAPGTSGATCDALHPCASSLACKNGTCSPPDAASASCVAGTYDGLAGDYCKLANMATTGTCTKLTLASPGQPCGNVGGVGTLCTGGGVCHRATGSIMGTCIPPASDFAACDATNGPGCMLGAACIGKVCTRPSPATCH